MSFSKLVSNKSDFHFQAKLVKKINDNSAKLQSNVSVETACMS